MGKRRRFGAPPCAPPATPVQHAVDAAWNVVLELGHYLPDQFYREAFAHDLTRREIPFRRGPTAVLRYRDIDVGTYETDFIVEESVAVSIISAPAISDEDRARVFTFARAADLKHALVINFGAGTLEWKDVLDPKVIYGDERF